MNINKKTAIFSGIAAVALTVFGLTTSAFKADKMEEAQVYAVQQWYAITPTSDTDLTKQIIAGSISTPPINSSTDCAQSGNFGNYCGVLLSFPSTVPNLNGKTVQQAITQNNATIVTGSGSVGYSRLP